MRQPIGKEPILSLHPEPQLGSLSEARNQRWLNAIPRIRGQENFPISSEVLKKCLGTAEPPQLRTPVTVTLGNYFCLPTITFFMPLAPGHKRG